MSIGLNNLTSFHNITVYKIFFENKNDHRNDANYVTKCQKTGYNNLTQIKNRDELIKNQRGNS